MKTSKHLPFLVIALCISLAQAFANDTKPASLLWKISGNGLEQPSYLFGTIHLICPDDFKMDERILQALNSCEQLALEIDITDQANMLKMMQLSVNPGMENIQSKFSDEHREKIDTFFKNKYGVGLDQFGLMKPFVLSSMVAMASMSCKQPDSYELFLSTKAKESGKEIHSLETVDFQFSIFDNIPLDEQIKSIEESVLDMKKSTTLFDKMLELYLREEIDLLLEFMLAEPMMIQYEEELLVKRNEDWIPKIEKLVKTKTTFVAVGAGHLGGEKGVVNLLKNAGFAVEAVLEVK